MVGQTSAANEASGYASPALLLYSERAVMEPNKSTLERAFELARSGRCASVEELRHRLKKESYNQELVTGRSLTIQLRALMAAAKKA